MGKNYEIMKKCPLYNYHYTLSGVAYIFKAYFIPYRDENRFKKQFFTTLSAISISVISVFCINKERKVQETIQDPLKKTRTL